MNSRLRKSQCSILSLVLTRKWFEMIEDGYKREEYREASRFWLVRLQNWVSKGGVPVVEFRLGYSSDAPRMYFWCLGHQTSLGLCSYSCSTNCNHPEWGEPRSPHFVIKLGGPATFI